MLVQMRILLFYNLKLLNQLTPSQFQFSPTYCPFRDAKKLSSKATEKKIAECYQVLKIPSNSKQDVVRQAFLELAKKYHPDSGSTEADMDKFITIEEAFRTLTEYNTGVSNKEEVEEIVYDIKHTAPQHRQYLSYEGLGHGTVFQREKQYAQSRAQKAADNVMQHRIEKAIASKKTLMIKGSQYKKRTDISTRCGFDKLAEDLILESMSKGEFENLSGIGKPLKNQMSNPYVDFMTHKLNEVLKNNGFTPEWITLGKEIDQDICKLKQEIRENRMQLGPYPLSEADQDRWDKICSSYREIASSIDIKINKYNLIVPLLNKQKFHVDIDRITEDVLINGVCSDVKPIIKNNINDEEVSKNRDNLTEIFEALCNMLTSIEKKVSKFVK